MALQTLRTRIRVRRSTMSATTPPTRPKKNEGACCRPNPNPTMNGDPVSVRITQPNATFSPIHPNDSNTVAPNRKRKSRQRRTGASKNLPTGPLLPRLASSGGNMDGYSPLTTRHCKTNADITRPASSVTAQQHQKGTAGDALLHVQPISSPTSIATLMVPGTGMV